MGGFDGGTELASLIELNAYKASAMPRQAGVSNFKYQW